MKTKASLQYQLNESKKAVIVYYIVVLLSIVAGTIIAAIVKNMFDGRGLGNINVGNFETITPFFLAIVGLCSFKDNFLMMVQNGTSRRSLFLGRIGTSVALAVVLTAADYLVSLLAKLLLSLIDGFTLDNFGLASVFNDTLANNIATPIFFFAIYLAAQFAGYLVTSLFYRLNRGWQIAIGVGAPAFIIIIFPIIDGLVFEGAITSAIMKFIATVFGFASGNAWLAVLSSLVLAALLAALSWLLIRRVRVK